MSGVNGSLGPHNLLMAANTHQAPALDPTAEPVTDKNHNSPTTMAQVAQPTPQPPHPPPPSHPPSSLPGATTNPPSFSTTTQPLPTPPLLSTPPTHPTSYAPTSAPPHMMQGLLPGLVPGMMGMPGMGAAMPGMAAAMPGMGTAMPGMGTMMPGMGGLSGMAPMPHLMPNTAPSTLQEMAANVMGMMGQPTGITSSSITSGGRRKPKPKSGTLNVPSTMSTSLTSSDSGTSPARGRKRRKRTVTKAKPTFPSVCRHEGCFFQPKYRNLGELKSRLLRHERSIAIHRIHFHETHGKCKICQDFVNAGVWDSFGQSLGTSDAREVCAHTKCKWFTRAPTEAQRREAKKAHESWLGPHRSHACKVLQGTTTCSACSALFANGVWISSPLSSSIPSPEAPPVTGMEGLEDGILPPHEPGSILDPLSAIQAIETGNARSKSSSSSSSLNTPSLSLPLSSSSPTSKSTTTSTTSTTTSTTATTTTSSTRTSSTTSSASRKNPELHHRKRRRRLQSHHSSSHDDSPPTGPHRHHNHNTSSSSSSSSSSSGLSKKPSSSSIPSSLTDQAPMGGAAAPSVIPRASLVHAIASNQRTSLIISSILGILVSSGAMHTPVVRDLTFQITKVAFAFNSEPVHDLHTDLRYVTLLSPLIFNACPVLSSSGLPHVALNLGQVIQCISQPQHL